MHPRSPVLGIQRNVEARLGPPHAPPLRWAVAAIIVLSAGGIRNNPEGTIVPRAGGNGSFEEDQSEKQKGKKKKKKEGEKQEEKKKQAKPGIQV